MEIKKTKKASLENKKKSIFLFGLLTSLGLLLMAFEWANYDINYKIPAQEYGELVITEPAVLIVTIKKPEPPAKTSPQKKIDETVKVTKVKVEKKDSVLVLKKGVSNENKITKIELSQQFSDRKPPVLPSPFFTIVEEMPNFVGGEEALFRYMRSKIKYTSFARESGIQGKISIQFVVEKDGSITNIHVLNELDHGLEKNALKTIKEMRKWNPGKQRGKNVRVQMVIPIVYKLN